MPTVGLRSFIPVYENQADSEDYPALESYLQEISEDIPKALKTVDCGNRSMNEILNLEMAKIEKLGIPMDVQVIVPKELPFKESDLCSLVVNAIDNALEGWVEKAEGGCIRIRMVMQGDELLFSVTNPTDKNKELLTELRTTKENEAAHGYGTKTIRRILEKYHGYCEYDITDGQFCFNCILNQ